MAIPLIRLTCDLCGKKFWRKQNRIGAGKHYCGKTCSARASRPKPKYPTDQNAFLREDANSFYLLGAYMTDGHINTGKSNGRRSRYNIAITSKDKDWMEAIRDVVCPNHPIYEENRKNCFRFECITGGPTSPIITWLKSYGCKERKSLTLRLTKSVPKTYRADFIRGVIDGDGCIYYSEKQKPTKHKTILTRTCRALTVSIASASRGFLIDILDILPKQFTMRLRRDRARSSIVRGKPLIPTKKYNYKLSINGKKAIEFLRWVYYPNHQLGLPRKQHKANWILTNVVFDGVIRIRPLSTKIELKCLQCNMVVMIYPNEQKRGRQFCSQDCRYLYQEEHNWSFTDKELLELYERYGSTKQMVPIVGMSNMSIWRRLKSIQSRKVKGR